MFDGLLDLPWWGILLATLGLTHITIVSVTIFLHRHQAHRALTLHPVASHFFRFWLWLTTGTVTKEWTAIHRKHHAKVETAEDPHSPVQKGINRVLWTGALLYHQESRVQETMDKYGTGTPDDYIERNLYSRHSWLGIGLMLGLDLVLFGIWSGAIVWLVQMLWIPFWAAGVINGIGHFWGYRNFETRDASTNIVPWGILIGGEELHNNHHTYASSAKMSAHWWEFDIGWMYISLLQMLGLAKVKKLPPRLVANPGKKNLDLDTVKAVLRSRFLIMVRFSREVTHLVQREEMRKANRHDQAQWALLKRARQLMKKDRQYLNPKNRERLQNILQCNGALSTVYEMKRKLQNIWESSSATQEHLLQALEEWCHLAETAGINALKDFSMKLRTYTLVPAIA